MENNGNGTGSNAVWAIALVVVVAIIAALVYYSGILKKVTTNPKVDVKITAPAPAAPAPATPAPATPAAPVR